MPGLILTLLCAMLFFPVSAQYLQLASAPETVTGQAGEQLTATLEIKNISDKEILLMVKKSDQKLLPGQELTFGLPQQGRQGAMFPAALAPGEVFKGFAAHLVSHGNATGESSALFRFFDANDPGIFLDVAVVFRSEQPNSPDKLLDSDKITISNLYPNPATSTAYFDYRLSAKGDRLPKAFVVIRNVLGSEVARHQLFPNENQLKVPLETYKPGMYFYTLSIDDQNLATKKFMVKK